MIELKDFYQKLEILLGKIKLVKSGTDFLFIIVKEIGNLFGNDLHIGAGRIYEKKGENFLLISPVSKLENLYLESTLPADSLAVKSVLYSKTFIFDDDSFPSTKKLSRTKKYSVPAAIAVENLENSWILIFELNDSWLREEIEFCFNTIRSVLMYKFLSESIKTEYEQAFLIQKSLLPTFAPKISGYQIAGTSQQAELVGGDIFDYYEFNKHAFGFSIGDASGHGIPAALMARDAIIGLRMGLANNTKMIYTMEKLNKVIYKSVYSTRFISLFYGEIEAHGNLFYINAGHPSPILICGNESTELVPTSLVFGAMKDIDIRLSHIKILPGSVLVLYTDGVVERINSMGENFGIGNLKEVIIKNKYKNAAEILKSIFSAADKFGSRSKWDDDATVVVIKRLEQVPIQPSI